MKITLTSYDKKELDDATSSVVNILEKSKCIFAGPVPLPVEEKIFTVNRSPHVYKKSREQFKLATYKRLINVSSNAEIAVKSFDSLGNNFSKRVAIKIRG